MYSLLMEFLYKLMMSYSFDITTNGIHCKNINPVQEKFLPLQMVTNISNQKSPGATSISGASSLSL